jgi:membrane associated rhomboid family serine protease
MTVRLILVNVAVFLAAALAYLLLLPASGSGPAAAYARDQWLVQWLRSSADLHVLATRPWTVVTYMFTHTGVGHIFWNMLLLWFGGRLFEDLLGGRRLLGFYLLGGVAGLALWIGLVNALPLLHGTTGILGASAAVLAVFVGIAAYNPGMEVNLMLFGPVKLMYVAAVFVLLDLVGIGTGDGVAHEAHIGGALMGFVLARQLKRGNDWALRLVDALEQPLLLLRGKRGPRLRVEKRSARSAAASDARYNQPKRDTQARVDAILDKISRSGYDSLTKEEKDFLFKAGNG